MRGQTSFKERKSDFFLDFPTFGSSVIFGLRSKVVHGWGFVEAWMAVFLVPKSLNQVKKIPTSVAVNSADPRVILFM